MKTPKSFQLLFDGTDISVAPYTADMAFAQKHAPLALALYKELKPALFLVTVTKKFGIIPNYLFQEVLDGVVRTLDQE